MIPLEIPWAAQMVFTELPPVTLFRKFRQCAVHNPTLGLLIFFFPFHRFASEIIDHKVYF